MRIISGQYGSRIIAMPKGVAIRPTQDKVREAVFNIIGNVSGKNVLDLFAGSGAFGIEAISRGAMKATFVDNNLRCIETIKANLESLGIPEDKYNIIRGNALTVMPRLEKEAEKYDIILLDPPYHMEMAKKCLINIDSYDILTKTAMVVAEHFKKDTLDIELNTLILEKERNYGDTVVTILRKIDEERENSGISGDV